MDEQRVVDALLKVTDPDGFIFRHGAEDRTEIGLKFYLTEKLEQDLAKEPEFARGRLYMIQTVAAPLGFEVHRAAHFLICSLGHLSRRKQPVGAAEALKAVEALKKVLSATRAEARYILALHGVRVEQATQLTEHISLVPFMELPQSDHKDLARSLQDPTAALAYRLVINPYICEGDSPPVSTEIPPIVDNARLALVAAGRLWPMGAGEWTQFDDADLHRAATLNLRGTPHDILPQSGSPAHLDADMAREAVSGFLALNADDRDRVSLVLERLLNSRVRRQPRDTALELGIAFEVLLSDKDEKPGEHTHKISVRAARYRGGTTEERKATRALVRKLYDLRSAAVHFGKIDKSVKLEVLRDADEVATALVQDFLRRRQVPDWLIYDLSEHA